MIFTLPEKLAIVHLIDSLIIVDTVIHVAEIEALAQLMPTMDFDSNFLISARNMIPDQGLRILKEMNPAKKQWLAQQLQAVAKSDGFVHEKETSLLIRTCTELGIAAPVHD